MVKVLSKEEIEDIRKRMDGPQEPSYSSLSLPFDDAPDDAWCRAYVDLDHLLRSHEELRRRLDAAQTRLQAEADRCARTAHPFGHDREEWLRDIIGDLEMP